MKPPPPMLPALGKVTASAKPTATAASTALPPAGQHVEADLGRPLLLAHHHSVRRGRDLRLGGAGALQDETVLRRERCGENEDREAGENGKAARRALDAGSAP